MSDETRCECGHERVLHTKGFLACDFCRCQLFALSDEKAGEATTNDIGHIAERFVDADLAHDNPVYAVSIMAQIIDAQAEELARLRPLASSASALREAARRVVVAYCDGDGTPSLDGWATVTECVASLQALRDTLAAATPTRGGPTDDE